MPWVTLIITLFAISCQAQEILNLRGSLVAARPLEMASDAVKKAIQAEYRVVTEGSRDEAIFSLGNGIIDAALLTRPLSGSDRAQFPGKQLIEYPLGRQAVVLVVPKQVWNSGVRALTKEQFRRIYEREVTNWKQLGGEDRDITFFNRDPALALWDVFMIFLYGDARRAPLSRAEIIGTPEDLRVSVEFNGGSIGLLEMSELLGDGIFPLGLKAEDGSIIEATPANVANGRYPMSRPILLAVAGKPTGKLRGLIEFMQSEPGQAFVRKAGHLTNADLK